MKQKMSDSQVTAFQAMGGFTPQQSTMLLSGLVLTVALVFAAWTIVGGYRGWASGQLSQGRFFGLVFKVSLIYILLTALVLH